MANRYRPVDRDQQFLLPVDMQEWLPPGHLVWFVIDAVKQMDTSGFHAGRVVAGVGRAAFDPDMLVMLLVYAYCGGVRSSRQIERQCEVDVAFRVICAGDGPDHSTIARFRARHEVTFGDFFVAVLRLAAHAGVGRFGTVAVDGTKLAADASIDVNRDEAWLREQAARVVREAAAVDAAEDAEFGEARGDELPKQLADPRTRAGAIQAALAELEAQQRAAAEAAEAAEAAARAGAVERLRQLTAGEATGPGKVSDLDAVEIARLRLVRAEAAQQAKIDAAQARQEAVGTPLRGRPPAPVGNCLPVLRARGVLERAVQRQARRAAQTLPLRRLRVNLTDPQSRVMPTRKGWVQGYNVQLAATADQMIVAVRVSQQPVDFAEFQPMMAAVKEAAELFRAEGREDAMVSTLLADAGYLSNENLTAEGPDRLIALDSGRNQRKKADRRPAEGPPPKGVTARQVMDHRLRTPQGAALYRQRGATVEPAIGNLKKIITRFSRRGQAAAIGELNLAVAAFNLMKIYRARPATG